MEALKSGRKDGMGGLSPRTVAYHHRILSEALEHAVRQNLLVRNPAKVADPPRPARADIAMLAAEDTRPLPPGGRLRVSTSPSSWRRCTQGARLGELLALQWRNVDLDAGVMRITHTLYRTGSEWHLKERRVLGAGARSPCPELSRFTWRSTRRRWRRSERQRGVN